MENQNAVPFRRKRKKTNIYPKSLIMFVILAVLILVEYFRNGGYVDEVIGLFSIILILFNITRISTQDILTLILITIVAFLGLLSNLVYGINTSIFSVFVDLLTQTKFMFAFYAIKYSLTNKEKQRVAEMILPIARVYFIIAFVCAILSLFVDLGFRGTERYGVYTFNFIFTFNFQYTSISFLMFGSIIATNKLSEKKKNFYYIIGVLAILASLKSPGLMFTAIFVGLFFYFKKHDRLSIQIIIPMVLIGIWLGNYQINEYLLNENAPRRIFFEYAVTNANDHFPLGSGFGTFGSAEAAKNYSQLYYQYGFDKLNGMNPRDGSFLSDTYWPMAIGQFGYLGGVLFIVIFVRLFLSMARSKTTGARRAFQYAVFFQFIIHAIGSAILTSSAGLIGIMALSLYTIPDFEEEKHLGPQRRIKIKI